MDIKYYIEGLTTDEKLNLLDSLYDKWIYEQPVEDPLALAMKNFEIDAKSIVHMGQYLQAYKKIMIKISYLRVKLEYSEDIDDERRVSIKNKFNILFKVIIDASNAISSYIYLKSSMTKSIVGSQDYMDMTRYSEMKVETNTAFQNLLLYVLEKLMRSGYRRYNSNCYERIYTPDVGYDTHCWKMSMSLEDFIYDNVRKELNYEMWQNLIGNGQDKVKSLVRYLTAFKGYEFEDIMKDKHIFSFNDGIYISCQKQNDLYIDSWHPYETDKLGPDIISCNYFNINFDISTRDMNWWDIILKKCPLFKSVMDYQEWEIEVQKWFCIMMGRCIYYLNELDNWQIMAFLLGQANSGKSTLINYVLKKFYEACDVATISNNIEHQFGLQTIYNKFLYVAPEIKGNFKLEQAEFQSMISGETMSIAVKHGDAANIDFKVPGMMAGNEVPQYTDNSGSVSRRLLVFSFDKKVKKSDTQLGNKLEKELGFILHACNRAYLEKVNVLGSQNIWNVVPEYFIKNRSDIAETTNSLVSFLKSDKIIIGSTQEIEKSLFVNAFNEYCAFMKFPRVRITPQFVAGPFSDEGIKTDRRTIKKDGQLMVDVEFYIGVSLNNQNDKREQHVPAELNNFKVSEISNDESVEQVKVKRVIKKKKVSEIKNDVSKKEDQ